MLVQSVEVTREQMKVITGHFTQRHADTVWPKNPAWPCPVFRNPAQISVYVVMVYIVLGFWGSTKVIHLPAKFNLFCL